MKNILSFIFYTLFFTSSFAQTQEVLVSMPLPEAKAVKAEKVVVPLDQKFTIEKINAVTPVKNQGNTGTCWAFSTTSLLESQNLKKSPVTWDLSEMFTVRNIYMQKAKNYVLRQGYARFSQGGLGHDVIHAISEYGALPENLYSGLTAGNTNHDHEEMAKELKAVLDSAIARQLRGNADNWERRYKQILDKYLGVVPENFTYNGNRYTPKTFAKDVLKFDETDYVNITSFTHHPFYQSFVLEVPDNFSNGSYFNLPLNEMIDLAKSAVKDGYTVMWDADVSNKGFQPKSGFAVFAEFSDDNNGHTLARQLYNASTKDDSYNAVKRQELFENLVTQDDHLMHIVGLQKNADGKHFFVVKNSWGNVGPFNGFINVSEGYFAINTISLIVPKAALSKTLLEKMKK